MPDLAGVPGHRAPRPGADPATHTRGRGPSCTVQCRGHAAWRRGLQRRRGRSGPRARLRGGVGRLRAAAHPPAARRQVLRLDPHEEPRDVERQAVGAPGHQFGGPLHRAAARGRRRNRVQLAAQCPRPCWGHAETAADPEQDDRIRRPALRGHLRHRGQGLRPGARHRRCAQGLERHEGPVPRRESGHLRLRAGRVRQVRAPRQGDGNLPGDAAAGAPQEHCVVRHPHQGSRQSARPRLRGAPLPGDAGGGRAVQPRDLQLPDGCVRALRRPADGGPVPAGHDANGHRARPDHVQHPDQGLQPHGGGAQGPGAVEGAQVPGPEVRRDHVQQPHRRLRQGEQGPGGPPGLRRHAAFPRVALEHHLLDPREAALRGGAGPGGLPPRGRDGREVPVRAEPHCVHGAPPLLRPTRRRGLGPRRGPPQRARHEAEFEDAGPGHGRGRDLRLRAALRLRDCCAPGPGLHGQQRAPGQQHGASRLPEGPLRGAGGAGRDPRPGAAGVPAPEVPASRPRHAAPGRAGGRQAALGRRRRRRWRQWRRAQPGHQDAPEHHHAARPEHPRRGVPGPPGALLPVVPAGDVHAAALPRAGLLPAVPPPAVLAAAGVLRGLPQRAVRGRRRLLRGQQRRPPEHAAQPAAPGAGGPGAAAQLRRQGERGARRAGEGEPRPAAAQRPLQAEAGEAAATRSEHDRHAAEHALWHLKGECTRGATFLKT
mmetsp:Transcript_61835/g.174261  ORF Transcript_61835/g.174261 Transcript_61835/m.174261 type:complete len:711 (-) Transcript_61835:156-2288(-)